MKEAVESMINSEFLNLTKKTGWLELSLSFLSAGVTEIIDEVRVDWLFSAQLDRLGSSRIGL
jgi:hypothetical protein